MDPPDVSTGSILFLGIDDFAFRRGYRFGTILVNLESHTVADLFPDREADTSAAWMKHHPDLLSSAEIVAATMPKLPLMGLLRRCSARIDFMWSKI
ncbi:transposase [Reticulibacter mediterranei]